MPLAAADPRPRVPRSELVMTQELVASMLGVRARRHHGGRRETAARRLDSLPPRPHRRARAVRAWRPASCECYAVVRRLNRLLCDVRYRQSAAAIAGRRLAETLVDPQLEKRSPSRAASAQNLGGWRKSRTLDLRIANAALSQLSYHPEEPQL